VRIDRGAQPRAQLTSTVWANDPTSIVDAGGVPPPKVIGEPVHGLSVTAASSRGSAITTVRIGGGTERGHAAHAAR
jgi:hypothetical protein